MSDPIYTRYPLDEEWVDTTTVQDAALGQRRALRVSGGAPMVQISTPIDDPERAYLKMIASNVQIYTRCNSDGTYTHIFEFRT